VGRYPFDPRTFLLSLPVSTSVYPYRIYNTHLYLYLSPQQTRFSQILSIIQFAIFYLLFAVCGFCPWFFRPFRFLPVVTYGLEGKVDLFAMEDMEVGVVRPDKLSGTQGSSSSTIVGCLLDDECGGRNERMRERRVHSSF